MTREQWQRVKTILDVVVRLPPDEREAYLSQECGNDRELRREVESLLAVAGTDESPDEGTQPVVPGGDALVQSSSPQDRRASNRVRDSSEPPPPAERSGVAWGSFTLLDKIGHGGFGTVYRAWDPVLQRDVALKLISLKGLSASTDHVVLREGQLMARVRHRNVVTIYSAQRVGSEVGLAMELIQGRTLAALVSQRGPLPVRDAIGIGMTVCEALAAVHRLGLVHRDVKASNVIKEKGGRVVLMDFGAGREFGVEASTGSAVVGTPSYMAPELFRGERAHVASDLYSVGVLLYYLVTRDYPVKGQGLAAIQRAHLDGERRRLADLRPDLPRPFTELVDRTLAPQVSDRPRTAGALRRELLAISAARGEAKTDPTSLTESADEKVTPPPIVVPLPVEPAAISVRRSVAVGVLTCALAIGLTAFLSTAAFNLTLARPSAFASEPVMTHISSGVRPLIPAVIFVAGMLILFQIAYFAVRLIGNLVPPVGRAVRAMAAGGSGALKRIGIYEAADYASATSVLGFVGLGTIVWVFRDLMAALMANVNDSPRRELSLLATSTAEDMHLHYRISLMLLLLALSSGVLISLKRVEFHLSRLSLHMLFGPIAAIVIALALYAASWRILFADTLPTVRLGTEPCFITGERGDNLLLNCPALEPPRNRAVLRTDPRLEHAGIGRLFDAYGDAVSGR